MKKMPAHAGIFFFGNIDSSLVYSVFRSHLTKKRLTSVSLS